MAKGQSSSGSDSKAQGAERFLVKALSHALEDGWRTPEDFLRHFKPVDLMTALEKAPDLRAALLVKAAGVHEKIARKKSTSSAAEDLRIALDEGLTTPAEVLALLPAEDRVRYLNRALLWTFVTEDQFWKGDGNRDRAIDRMTLLVQQALDQGLVNLQDVADGIGFDTISKRLPPAELQKVVLHALQTGRKKAALTEQSLLDVVPLRDLMKFVPLEHTWKGVIVAKVAQPAGFTGGDEGGWDSASEPEAEAAKPAAPAPAKAEPPPKPEKKAAAESKPKEVKPAEPKLEAPKADEPEVLDVELKTDQEVAGRESLISMTDEVDILLAPASRPAAEEEARRRVADRLRTIQRLPPRFDQLPTPILLSIDSMYADLLAASTDEAREMCIRESFPNEGHLTTALLALIELLDPSIDVNDPVIKEADVDSLIKVVLFEERHRYEQAHPSARPPTPPPPPANPRRSLTPPPLPRQSMPLPPPLPDLKR